MSARCSKQKPVGQIPANQHPPAQFCCQFRAGGRQTLAAEFLQSSTEVTKSNVKYIPHAQVCTLSAR